MFFSQSESPSPDQAIKDLLTPYLYLDKSLFKGGDDGLACFKKFSNQSNGMPVKERIMLNQLATAIREDKLKPENWLEYVDVLTLYSNHLDQQRFGEMLPLKEKEAVVAHLLEAALHLSPKYDYAHLERYSTRELSSHAQMLHYLGKAQRYTGVPVEARFVHITNALTIAKHLAALGCSEADDPHNYKGRIATHELVTNYCLQDMKRFDEAAALLLPQLSTANLFHVIQAEIQLSIIYTRKFEHTGADIDKALFHARRAVESSKAADNSLLHFNARIAEMNVLQAAKHTEEATATARAILSEMESPTCGAKPFQREAVEKILAANEPTSTLTP